MVVLLAPQHSCQRLSHDVPSIERESIGNDSGVEFVGLMLTRGDEVIKVVCKEGAVLMLGAVLVSRKRTVIVSPEDRQGIMGGDLSAVRRRVHCFLSAVHDIVVDPIFDIRGKIFPPHNR